MNSPKQVFASEQRIRLGIWGLGRGLSFFNTCQMLNIDVVAGCDFNQHLRDRFVEVNPKAFVTDDAEQFIEADFDAVLLATFCPAHAGDAIRCLKAGKHVLSEVTGFHTMAEGVRLVETVEETGKVYNLSENFPFSAANMWLARKWREGLFGELMYAEYEYVHERRDLAYTYGDGQPIHPGNQAHAWRSWLNIHYYNTHSLGPMMHITELRPTRVTALPATSTLAGHILNAGDGRGGIAPSLINMSNGAVVRNLMGSTTNDTDQQRIWGTLGSAEIIDERLRLRLGASGHSPKFEINPQWDKLGELAKTTGHEGGDFWTLYNFARHILEGQPAFFDVYRAADCTIPGILAYRSSINGGQPFDVPDLRDPTQRDAYRQDNLAQPPFDHRNGLFPADADESLTTQFSLTMRDLVQTSTAFRAYRDWKQVLPDMTHPENIVSVIDRLIEALPRLKEVKDMAEKIIKAYPSSVGAVVLGEMLEMCDEVDIIHPEFVRRLEKERDEFR